MTTSPSEGDDGSASDYTDMQIHDAELPDDLQPENDIGPSGAQRPEQSGDAPGVDDQLGQVPDATKTGSEGEAASSDAPS